ncbi:hypothetical protein ACHAXS_000059, partial [Conticribra weissflogii]
LGATTHWKDVSISYARFEIYLKQFAKVPLHQHDLIQMLRENLWTKTIVPTKFKMFIYTVEQLHDVDYTRQKQFRHDLQHFLRLNSPFPEFVKTPKVNENREIYPEYLDLCRPEFNYLRHELLKNGNQSSQWIRDEFIHAEDVVVSNEEHFNDVLQTWGQDPCN